MAVNIFTDWDPLKEIILGAVDPNLESDPFLSQIWKEVAEDFNTLKTTLETRNILVKQAKIMPDLSNASVTFNDKQIAERTTFPLAIRDFSLVAGNNILTSSGSYTNRYFEDWHLYELFMDYHMKGSSYESMPKPPSFNHPEYANRTSTGCDMPIKNVQDQVVNKLYQTKTLAEAKELSLKYDQRFLIYRTYLKDFLVFHAAGVAHLGDTLIRTRCGSELGCQWFDRWAKNKGFKVRVWDWAQGHIDGQISFIRPGLYVANKQMHESILKYDPLLSTWDSIVIDYAPLGRGLQEMDDIIQYKNFDQYKSWLNEWTGMEQPFSFDVNLLSLDANTVVVPETNSPVVEELEKRGVTVIQTPWRHRHFIKNGIHCCTLDTVRGGSKENYF